jgi:hypothetical protein
LSSKPSLPSAVSGGSGVGGFLGVGEKEVIVPFTTSEELRRTC